MLLIYVVEITSPISSDPCSAYEKLVLRILFCNQLEEKKRDIENRIEANTRWTAGFDTDLGPFEQLYRSQTQEIASIYGDAKARHKEGIKVLVDEFSYHPEFFRPKDTFHATPFVPK